MKPVSRLFADAGQVLAGAQFADSYALTVDGLRLDAIIAAQRVVGQTPAWIAWLMAIRNLAVKPLRLKTSFDRMATPDARIGWFPVISRSAHRVVLGFDDRHLDFRILVEVKELGVGLQEVSASTAVKTHNLPGRIYLEIVKPFHRIIVPAMLARIRSA